MRTKPTRSLITIIILQLIALLLASCASAADTPVVTETSGATGTHVVDSSKTVTDLPTETRSSTPTQTYAATRTPPPTLVPSDNGEPDGRKISPENVDHLAMEQPCLRMKKH